MRQLKQVGPPSRGSNRLARDSSFAMLSPQTVLVGLGGGLASAVLFYSAARGGVFLKLVLFILTPMPALIAALGWGVTAAIFAAVSGALIMAFAATPAFGVGYFLMLGLPLVLLAWLSDLGRVRPDGSGTDWYPPGHILADTAVYAGLLPSAIAMMIGGSFAALKPDILPFVRVLTERMHKQLGAPAPTEAAIEGWANLMIEAMPATIAGYWLLLIAINLYLAGRVTYASGHLIREWPDFHRLAFPMWMPLALAVAFGLTLLDGTFRLIGSGLAGALLIAYALMGLSVLHCISKGRVPWLLWLTYAMLLNPAGPYVMILLSLIGLAEPVIRLRDRLSKSGPPPPAATST